MMRREFDIQLESSVPGFKVMRAKVRIDGDPTAGNTVSVNARVPNIKGDVIPDKLDVWQKPKQYKVGADGFVRVSVEKEWGKVSLRAKVLAQNGTEYFVGDGKGRLVILPDSSGEWLAQDHTFKVTRSKRTLFEELPAMPEPVQGKWAAKEIHSLSAVYKFKTIVAVGADILTTSYNRVTRVYSAIDRLRNGKKEMIWEANKARGQSAETIGGGVRLGNTVYFIPEVSKNVLKYDTSTGKVSKGSSLPHPFAVECCLWGDRVVYGASNEGGSTTAIYDAATGAKVMDSPINGLISALAADGANLWWTVAGKGVCNSRGESWKLPASCIAIWGGVPHVGAQDSGNLYYLDGETWKVKQTYAASKINRLVVDTRDNCLLLSAANPDTFLRLLPNGTVETLGRWTDQGVQVSGEQFDTYINEGPNGTILGVRALKEGCKAYQFSLVGSQPVPEPPKPPVEPPKPPAMPSDLPAAGQSVFLWKPNAEGGAGGLVVLFNKALIPFVKSATINGANSRNQVPPNSDGRGAIRWEKMFFSGPVTLTFNLSDGRKLNYAIPDGAKRWDNKDKNTPKVIRPTVSQ